MISCGSTFVCLTLFVLAISCFGVPNIVMDSITTSSMNIMNTSVIINGNTTTKQNASQHDRRGTTYDEDIQKFINKVLARAEAEKGDRQNNKKPYRKDEEEGSISEPDDNRKDTLGSEPRKNEKIEDDRPFEDQVDDEIPRRRPPMKKRPIIESVEDQVDDEAPKRRPPIKTTPTSETVEDQVDDEAPRRRPPIKTTPTSETVEDQVDDEAPRRRPPIKTTPISETVDNNKNDDEKKKDIKFGGNGYGECACKTSQGVCFKTGDKQCYFNDGASIVECSAGGSWEPFQKCQDSCELLPGGTFSCKKKIE